jgi:hypothetical protein
MRNSLTLVRSGWPRWLFFFLASHILLEGCSSWNLAPKETDPTAPTIQVYTYDLVASSATRWVVTFALGGNPNKDPAKIITDVGVCYSTTNSIPSLADNYITAPSPVLPTSIKLTVAEKGTHYFRAYIILKDGTTLYSRVGTFLPQ